METLITLPPLGTFPYFLSRISGEENMQMILLLLLLHYLLTKLLLLLSNTRVRGLNVFE